MLPDQQRRIVISNVYPDDNRGSAALTSAAITAAERAFPGCHVSLIAAEGHGVEGAFRHTRAAHPGIEILAPAITPDGRRLDGARAVLRSLRLLMLFRRSQSATVQRVRQADLVISRGGVLFAEHEGLRGALYVWLTAFPLVLAGRSRVPVVIYGGTVGPFGYRSSRLVTRWILRRAALLLVRDPRSFNEAVSLGLDPTKVLQVPDGVFDAEPPTLEAGPAAAARAGMRGREFGVVTVTRARGSAAPNRQLLENLAGLVRRVLDADTVKQVLVVVHVDGRLASDASISAALVSMIADKRVTLVREDWAPRELMALYGAARFVVGCRLHSTVFALIGGTPAFVVPMFGTKSEGLFEGLGLERFIVPSPEFDPSAIAAAIGEAVAEGEALRDRIRTIVSSARAQGHGVASALREAAGDRAAHVGSDPGRNLVSR